MGTIASKISLRDQVFRYKWPILITVILVIIESTMEVLFPLFIGFAINELLDDSFNGIIALTILGVLQLITGTVRRFYDARTYAGIYRQITPELVEREQKEDRSTSTVMARSQLLLEFVEFLELSIPDVVGVFVSLLGYLIIIAGLDTNVFLGCLGLLLLILLVYLATLKRNAQLNVSYDNQLEKQVEVLESKDSRAIRDHFAILMKWQVRLSDLDTINFTIVWFGIVALFVFTTIAVVDPGIIEYGLVFSLVLYVFIYIEVVTKLPDHIQQVIRLNEISKRISH